MNTPISPVSPPASEPKWRLAFLVGVATFLVGLGIGFRGANAFNDSAAFRSPLGGFTSQASASSTYAGSVEGLGSNAPGGTDVEFKQFWSVWQDIKQNYYKPPVEDKKLFYGALQGLAEGLGDPYTMYFPPKEAEDFSESLKGEFSGIGAEIGVKDDMLQVIAPLPGTPAERAGVKAGDYILKINGEDSISMRADEAVSKIRGPKGTKVSLSLGRRADASKPIGDKNKVETVDLEITRDTIVVKSAKYEKKPNNVAYIAISNFNEDAAETFSKLVDQALKDGAKSFIIDLRNDPGGYLDRATQIAGEWMPGQVVVMQRRQGQITDRYTGEGKGRLKGMPTVVLVNGGSASASEILAGALQDAGLAKIVGTKTFGKGSVQNPIEYPDGSVLKITISEWVTPNGRFIDKQGITPDVQVDMTSEDEHADKDPQLDKAVEILTTRGSAGQAGK